MAVDDSYTKALLHFDGADGSTTFTDESGKIWTGYGNAQLDTTYYKFKPSALLLDGTGDYIDTPDVDDTTPGNGNFTIDCQFRHAVNNVWETICAKGNSTAASTADGSYFLYANADNTYSFVCCYDGGSAAYAISTATITDSNWHHIAGVRSGTSIYLFLDGVLSATASIGTGTVNDVGTKLTIGRYGDYSLRYWNGSIDEFRFSKGIARWTANFTPPTQAYAPMFGGAMWFY